MDRPSIWSWVRSRKTTLPMESRVAASVGTHCFPFVPDPSYGAALWPDRHFACSPTVWLTYPAASSSGRIGSNPVGGSSTVLNPEPYVSRRNACQALIVLAVSSTTVSRNRYV
jgi:hypothetical protein